MYKNINNMELLAILFLGFILFAAFGIGGWIVHLFEFVIDFLTDGCMHGIGCIFWIIIIIVLLIGLL